MIEVQGLGKYYGSFKAIHDISFKIEAGEIIGLLGLNGAGKSTILKILGTFLAPTEGSAKIGGLSIEVDPDKVRSMIGYLPDHPPLYEEMRVRDYLIYVARLKGLALTAAQKAAGEAMELTQTLAQAEVHLSELSHGYRQRVGIAQAIVHRPQVIILDEPINGLDPIQIVEMRDLICSLKSRHTVILSSHILSEITRTCDRILVIDEGKLVAEGQEKELLSSSRELFIIELEVLSPEPLKLLGRLQEEFRLRQSSILSQEEGHCRLRMECHEDLRSRLAKFIVAEGMDLLALRRVEDGLESLFMKLVKKSEGA